MKFTPCLFALIAAFVAGCWSPVDVDENDPPTPESVPYDMGTFVTPRDFPAGLFDPVLMNEYYDLTAAIGAHVAIMPNWFDADNNEQNAFNAQLITDAKNRGFTVVVQSNFLNENADAPGTPDFVQGTSFTEQSVRDAYIDHIIALASFGPDVLLIGVEVNNLLFHGNRADFDAFKELSKQLYAIIKYLYPEMTVAISFQWDLLRLMGNQSELQGFENSLDIYAFSSYPSLFGIAEAGSLPPDYYDGARDNLPPGARTMVAESGWNSENFSTESEQALFYEMAPDLYATLAPEVVLITYLHDFFVPPDAPELYIKFGSMGLRKFDGPAKPAYDVVTGYANVR